MFKYEYTVSFEDESTHFKEMIHIFDLLCRWEGRHCAIVGPVCHKD